MTDKPTNTNQQPATKAHKPLFAEMIAQHPGLAEELAQQADRDKIIDAWKSGITVQYFVTIGYDDEWTDYTNPTPPDTSSTRLAWRIKPGQQATIDRGATPTQEKPTMVDRLKETTLLALQEHGCERLKDFYECGPVQRAAVETFLQAALEQQESVAWLIIDGEDCFATNERDYAMEYPESSRHELVLRNALAPSEFTAPPGYTIVKTGALQMVVNALRRDAAEGRVVRGEMADELLDIAPRKGK